MTLNIKQNFVSGLTTMDCNFIDNTTANGAYEKFTNTLQNIMDEQSPLKRIKRKALFLKYEPWMICA